MQCPFFQKCIVNHFTVEKKGGASGPQVLYPFPVSVSPRLAILNIWNNGVLSPQLDKKIFLCEMEMGES